MLSSPERHGRGALLGAALVAAPVLAGVGYSALAALGVVGVGATGLSASRLARALGDPLTWRALGWSVRVALLATLLAGAAAVLLAAAFRGARFTDRVGRALAVLPLPLPPVVAATSALFVLGQSGLLARLGYAAGVVRTPADMPALVFDPAGWAVVLALAWKEAPYLTLVAGALLVGRGTEAEEAARTLGATPWQAFRRVTWPALWRGLLPALVAVFAFAAGSYEVAALLGPSDPPALPVLMLERYEDLDLARRGEGYVLTLLALLLAAVAVAAHEGARALADDAR
jgi:putative spermidine/putrescine transport system permease protein